MQTEPHDEQDDEQDEDVTIMTAANGNVVQCSTQIHDYCFCAPKLSHLSVWDFVSHVDKVSRSSSSNRNAVDISDDEIFGDNGVDDTENLEDDEDMRSVSEHVQTQKSKQRRCQTFSLHPDHVQSTRKAHRLHSDPAKYYIPVLIGPTLPH